MVAQVDFSIVHSILLIYNTVGTQFDKITFVYASNTSVATLTLFNSINYIYYKPVQFDIVQYLLAGIFTGDLDFLV